MKSLASISEVQLDTKNHLALFNGNEEDLLGYIDKQVIQSQSEHYFISAIHIGGLMEVSDSKYMEALKATSINYADGISVELLAKLGGLSKIRRTPTTDLGTKLVNRFTETTSRPPRVALVGGTPGLAEKAASSLKSLAMSDIVFCTHGFKADKEWAEVFVQLEQTRPDIVFVGLGSPFETIFLNENRDALPQAIYVTCGGWFGFLAGEELRAPKIMRTLGLEWFFRLYKNPKRLWRRYFFGTFSLLKLVSSVLYFRISKRPNS